MSQQLVQQLVSGLLIGCVYSLIAIGLTLIWGVMNIVNFAHGDFLMLSMFVSFWLYTLLGFDPVVSIPICTVLLFVLGLLIYKFAVSRVMRGPMLAQLVVTFGISIFIANMAVLLWTPDYRLIDKTLLSGTWNFGTVQISVAKVVTSVGSVVVSGALYLFLTRARMGKAILATEMNRDSALLMGINTDRVNALSFGIGAVLVTLLVASVVVFAAWGREQKARAAATAAKAAAEQRELDALPGQRGQGRGSVRRPRSHVRPERRARGSEREICARL